MKIAIVGAGAIGGFLGARLSLAGDEVTFLARNRNLDAINANGFRLIEQDGREQHAPQVRAVADGVEAGAQDAVLLTVKAHQVRDVLPAMQGLLGPETAVVTMINGLPWWYFHRHGGEHDGMRVACLDPDATMFADLDCDRIVGCVVHAAAEVRAPGVVHLTGGRRFILGEPDRTRSARLAAAVDALNGAGLEAVATDDIRQAVWVKLLGNLSFNPIAALTGYLMNQICADEAVLGVIRPMIAEATAVCGHYGIVVPMTPDERIAIARQLGAARISMLQDLEQGRRMELDAVVGSTIELAEKAGIDVPAIRMVYALVCARAIALGTR